MTANWLKHTRSHKEQSAPTKLVQAPQVLGHVWHKPTPHINLRYHCTDQSFIAEASSAPDKERRLEAEFMNVNFASTASHRNELRLYSDCIPS
jgi:hypothetical protein